MRSIRCPIEIVEEYFKRYDIYLHNGLRMKKNN